MFSLLFSSDWVCVTFECEAVPGSPAQGCGLPLSELGGFGVVQGFDGDMAAIGKLEVVTNEVADVMTCHEMRRYPVAIGLAFRDDAELFGAYGHDATLVVCLAVAIIGQDLCAASHASCHAAAIQGNGFGRDQVILANKVGHKGVGGSLVEVVGRCILLHHALIEYRDPAGHGQCFD